MDHDGFISHAHKDESIAVAICKRLQSASIRCWLTARDTSPGEDWTNATWKAIGSSSVTLLVFSENTDAAPHLKREIVHAYYTRRVIIALRLTNTPPRRDFLFYLGNVRWFDVLNPTAEEQLEAVIAHIKGLITAGTAIFPKGAVGEMATRNVLNYRIGAPRASNYRTIGILKWAAITTSLLAVVGLMWMALWEPKERTSLAESHPRSMYPGSKFSPKPSPQAGEASSPAPTYNFTRFGLWQPANVGATPLAQQESRVTPLTVPAEGSTSVTPSPPPADVTHEGRAGLTSTVESHTRLFPPTAIEQVPHYHHQPRQGFGTLEAQRNVALVGRERDALESQLKEIKAKLQTTQKSADFLTTQRDELQRQLDGSESRAQTAQKNAGIAASERDALRERLKETENRAITAEKNEELATSQVNALQRQLEENEAKVRMAKNDSAVARSQRDALQSRLAETEAEAKTVQKNADLATRKRDALETQLSEAGKRAQLAEMYADLATRQRSALEDQLRKAQEKNAQLVKHNADLGGSQNSASKTQSRKEQEDAQPANAVADLAANQLDPGQTQPPNPGQNAKVVPLTQELNSSSSSGLP